MCASRPGSPEIPASKGHGEIPTKVMQTLIDELPDRVGSPDALSATPQTPRNVAAPRSFTPPPLVRRSYMNLSPMRKALYRNSVDEVRAVLDKSPTAASEPFFDHDFEPPVCCAVRLQCDAAIIRLLVEHGADLEAADKHGLAPKDLLQEAEAPAANQWEMLLQPSFSASFGFGDMVTHLHLKAAPSGLARATWYDALLLESPPTAHEMWCHTVTEILCGVDVHEK